MEVLASSPASVGRVDLIDDGAEVAGGGEADSKTEKLHIFWKRSGNSALSKRTDEEIWEPLTYIADKFIDY